MFLGPIFHAELNAANRDRFWAVLTKLQSHTWSHFDMKGIEQNIKNSRKMEILKYLVGLSFSRLSQWK